MIKRLIKTASILTLASALALAAAFFSFPEKGAEKKGKAFQRSAVLQLRGAYRNATAVIEGVCISSYTSKSGGMNSDYTVQRVISGSGVREGDTVTLIGADNIGSRKIIYLGHAVGEVHSENTEVYMPVADGIFEFDGESILLSGGEELPIELLENDINSLNEEMRVPYKYYFYSDIASLVKNCTSVFLARVEKITEIENADLYTNNRGEVIRQTGSYKKIDAFVLNGLYWQHRYGDSIEIRIPSGSESSILDNKTNEHFVMNDSGMNIIQGGVYAFFIKKSPDEKENYYFLVNACQGIIRIEGDGAAAHPLNSPFSGIKELKELTEALRSASGMPKTAE